MLKKKFDLLSGLEQIWQDSKVWLENLAILAGFCISAMALSTAKQDRLSESSNIVDEH